MIDEAELTDLTSESIDRAVAEAGLNTIVTDNTSDWTKLGAKVINLKHQLGNRRVIDSFDAPY
ncbi:MAG: hypothetical protein M1503_08220 [Thaumarchaeota archaeon]|nr:hypothetical protein [Nitrososphaerota archaeon]MCL5318226.1 hypothetical protein [Nitrososphaerota archaeon]